MPLPLKSAYSRNFLIYWHSLFAPWPLARIVKDRFRGIGGIYMRDFLMVAGICVAALYGVDALYFNGQYYDALISMMSDIYRHLG